MKATVNMSVEFDAEGVLIKDIREALSTILVGKRVPARGRQAEITRVVVRSVDVPREEQRVSAGPKVKR